MNYQEIFAIAKSLSREDQLQLILSLSQSVKEGKTDHLRSRCVSLINKHGRCPHCDGSQYYRYGTARGAQRFKCNSCCRTFCEYTGTWLEGIHNKSLIVND